MLYLDLYLGPLQSHWNALLSADEYGPDVGLPYLIIRQGVTDYMEILIKTLTWQQSQTDGVTECESILLH